MDVKSRFYIWTNFQNWFQSRGDKKWNDKNGFYFERGKNDYSHHYRGSDCNSPGYNTVHSYQESFIYLFTPKYSRARRNKPDWFAMMLIWIPRMNVKRPLCTKSKFFSNAASNEEWQKPKRIRRSTVSSDLDSVYLNGRDCCSYNLCPMNSWVVPVSSKWSQLNDGK